MTTRNVTHFAKQNLDDRSNKMGNFVLCSASAPTCQSWTHRAPSLPTYPFVSLSFFRSPEKQMVLTAHPGGQQRVLSFWCKTLYFLIIWMIPLCTGASHRGTLALAAGICTRLSLTGTGVGLEALQTFFQSKFKDTKSIHGASYVHKCTIMFQMS